MGDKLNELFRDRFADHAADVPQGMWEAIHGQLADAAAADGGDGLEDLFRDRFAEHSVDVDPGVWSQVASQLGHPAAAAAGGTAWGAWLAAGVAAVVTAGALYWTRSEDVATTPVDRTTPRTEQQAPMPTQQEPEEARSPQASTILEPEVEAGATVRGKTVKENIGTTPDALVADADAEGRALVERILRDLERTTPAPVASASDGVGPEPVALPKAVPMAAAPSPGTVIDGGAAEPAETAPVARDPAPVMHIPNVFTPNGDGVNDQHVVQGADYERVTVRIFSARTNAMVFQANDLQQAWDGRLPDGAHAEPGMYFYAIEVIGKDGQAYSLGEVITLSR